MRESEQENAEAVEEMRRADEVLAALRELQAASPRGDRFDPDRRRRRVKR